MNKIAEKLKNQLEKSGIKPDESELLKEMESMVESDDIIEYIPKDNMTFEDRNMKIMYGTRFSKVMRMPKTIHTICVEPSESFANDSEIL